MLGSNRSERVPKIISEDDDDDVGEDDYLPKPVPLKNFPVHHIPLGEVFKLLPNLTEIHINIAVIYRSDDVYMKAFE